MAPHAFSLPFPCPLWNFLFRLESKANATASKDNNNNNNNKGIYIAAFDNWFLCSERIGKKESIRFVVFATPRKIAASTATTNMTMKRLSTIMVATSAMTLLSVHTHAFVPPSLATRAIGTFHVWFGLGREGANAAAFHCRLIPRIQYASISHSHTQFFPFSSIL